jgi:hypothetical protein
MQSEAGRDLGVDFREEPEKFLMPMARHAVADNRAVEHAEGRKQGSRAVPLVIVRLRAAAAPPQRQARLRAIESLDLALLVDAQHQGFVRGIQIEPQDVGQLLEEVLVAAELEGLDPMRLQVVALPDALHRGLAEPWARAIVRVLQCVAAGGVVCTVASTTARIFFAETLGLRPGRGASCSSPATRRANLERHRFHGDWNYIMRPHRPGGSRKS